MIRSANKQDSQTIASIYNHYIENTFITFETETVDSEEIDARIQDIYDRSLSFKCFCGIVF